METNLENLLNNVSGHLRDMAQTKTVIGEEFKIGDYTCKPVIKLGMGFGSGLGSDDNTKMKGKGTGTGAGGGIGIQPVGFLVTNKEEISFIPAHQKKGFQEIMDKVPDLMEKIIEMKEKKESGSDNEKSRKKSNPQSAKSD